MTDEVRELRAERRAAKDDDLRQQLTYKVLKDKLVHSRLKAKVAEEKARLKVKAVSDAETKKMRELLAAQKEQMQGLESKVTALAARKSAAKHHRSRLSSKAAQQDLSSYFSRLDRREAKEEVAEAKAKLAKLTGLLGVSATKGSKGAKSHKHVAAAKRSKHVGSLLEATALFDKGSDDSYGLGESRSAHQEAKAKAKEEQLAIVDTPAAASSGSNLDSLVQQLKADTTNVAPYLPL